MSKQDEEYYVYESELDFAAYSYDTGYEDAMAHDVDWYFYRKDYAYADGVDDAEEYLYEKYLAEKRWLGPDYWAA